MESFLIVLLNNYIAVLKKYMVFTGRSSRKEFWFFLLVNVVVVIAFSILSRIPILGVLIRIARFLFVLAILVPSVTVGIRRLHDINLSGWFLPLCLIIIPIFFLCVIEGNQYDNQYGPIPQETT